MAPVMSPAYATVNGLPLSKVSRLYNIFALSKVYVMGMYSMVNSRKLMPDFFMLRDIKASTTNPFWFSTRQISEKQSINNFKLDFR